MQAPGDGGSGAPAHHLTGNSVPPLRTPEKTTYAQIARPIKREHPPPTSGGAPNHQSSETESSASRPLSAASSPHAKIQKREASGNAVVSMNSATVKTEAKQNRPPRATSNSNPGENRSATTASTKFRPPAHFRKTSKEKETEPKRLSARQKQIDFGKNTIGYQRYTAEVPRSKRTPNHPWTPDRDQICSKRSWDGQVRKWRRMLHEWDPPGTAAPDDGVDDNSELQPDEGLLHDENDSASVSASASSSSLHNNDMQAEGPAARSNGNVSSQTNGSAPTLTTTPSSSSSSTSTQRKLLWSDIGDEDEMEMHEIQPPPST